MPEVHITGTFKNPVQPTFIPVSVTYTRTECLEALTSLDTNFDYVHCRRLWEAIKVPEQYFGQVYDRLRPGGNMQHEVISWLSRCNWSIPKTPSSLIEWGGTLQRVMNEGAGELESARIQSHLENAGFVDVSEEAIKFSLQDGDIAAGGWFKFGLLTLLRARDLAPLPWLNPCRQSIIGTRFYSQPWLTLLEDIDKFVAVVEEEIKTVDVHFEMRIWRARKPADK
ncbi:methyltransferase domain-containing protein [Colletotrichum chrysophilum]|uniref:Methyltransferase domain-containing protein n=1 Tax=Colletotrichum chrysophilum TaxID=1836956 RepID=A0AAD9A552_9PEZI|nr:methyltransferase domain-containing protein [Colletotrichum chrysophilum]